MYYIIEAESGLRFDGIAFESGATAAVYAKLLSQERGKKYQVRVELDGDWEKREIIRFQTGEYLPVAWEHALFWIEHREIHQSHYAHRSKDKSHLIAYTESPEKGSQDRQTRIKAGAYLTKYFSHVLNESEINHYARLHAAIQNAQESEIKFAITSDEIQEIYLNGPDSCMSGTSDEFRSYIHPVRVYGDSDLQLAYVERDSDYHDKPIAARALIWPEKRIYGRVYPTPERYSGSNRIVAKAEHDGLIAALEKLGFQHGSFSGAKIRAIYDSRYSSYVMPYLDGIQNLDLTHDSDGKEVFVIHKHGDYCASNTNGLLDEINRPECDQCGSEHDEEDSYTVRVRGSYATWCSDCLENHTFFCYGEQEHMSDYSFDRIEADDGHIYSSRYAENHFGWCEHDEIWCVDGTLAVNTGKGDMQSWGNDAIENHAFMCHSNSEYYCSDNFESVEIDGEIYEKQNAIKAGLIEIESIESETV